MSDYEEEYEEQQEEEQEEQEEAKSESGSESSKSSKSSSRSESGSEHEEERQEERHDTYGYPSSYDAPSAPASDNNPAMGFLASQFASTGLGGSGGDSNDREVAPAGTVPSGAGGGSSDDGGFGLADIGGLAGLAALAGKLPHGFGGSSGGASAPPPDYSNKPVHYGPPPPVAGQSYQYSNCSGKRKALIIGINYVGQEGELGGCQSDAIRMQKFLQTAYGYRPEDMVLLLDEPSYGQQGQPTRANIIRGIEWLVYGAASNDSLFWHYSGHGGQSADLSGDEADGHDECIYPLDFKEAGEIIDDELHARMVQSLPEGCRLTAIFDSCHSGSVLDLPFIYATSGQLKEPGLSSIGQKDILDAAMTYLKGDSGGAMKKVMGIGKMMWKEKKAADKLKKTNASPADVVLFSGCKDSQTSADAVEGGTPTGAMSWAFMTSLAKYPQQSYEQLLNTIRDELKVKKYDQKPQLSCSHPLDTDLVFIA